MNKFCSKCGNELKEGEGFCSKCGNNVNDEEIKAQTVVNNYYSSNSKVILTKREIAVAIILTIVTCGIYGIYWFVCLTNDANKVSGRTSDTSGGVALFLTIITCGIYGIYWAYQMGEAIYAAKAQRGYVGSSNGVLYLILQLVFAIIGWCLMQDEINKLIVADSGNYGPRY